MELAWKLLLPARAGQERELETVHRRIDVLWEKFDDADEDEEPEILAEIERMKMQRQALSQSIELPMQLAGAPRLGIDPAAEAWLRRQRDAFAENGKWSGTPPWDDFVAAYVQRWKGGYILDASNPLAVPWRSAPEDLAGPYAVDVSFLRMLDGLDQELIDEATTRHDAAAMLDYKERLLAAIAPMAIEPELEDDAKFVVGLIVSIANWLQFWAGHGFGFEPVNGDDATPDD
jgi:hypothetical protein